MSSRIFAVFGLRSLMQVGGVKEKYMSVVRYK